MSQAQRLRPLKRYLFVYLDKEITRIQTKVGISMVAVHTTTNAQNISVMASKRGFAPGDKIQY